MTGTKKIVNIELPQATNVLFKKQASLKNICARGQSNCFVKMKASSIKDTSGNELSQAVTKAVVQNPVDDSVPPQLLSFAFDSSREEIVLTFNDVMEVSTLNTKKITFQSSPGSNPVAAHTLSGDYSAQLTAGQSFEIKLQLTSEDVNKIKLDANLATTSANTYASVDLLAAQDVFGNLLTSITPSNAKKVSNFTADTKAPELFAFSVNLNQTDAELGLTFTEPVKLSSFQYPLITLHGEKNSNQDTTHTLNDVGGHSATISSSGRVVTIAVAHKDVNEIKALSGLANKRERALLSLAEGVVSDMNDIKSTSLSVLNARTADTYIADEFAPVMTKFDLDMDTAQLTLYFSETVNTGSLDLDGELVIVDAASGSGTESVTLSGFVSFSSVDSSTIRVNLTNSDITSLQQRYGLATTNMTTYAEVRSGAVKDMANNPVRASTSRISVGHFTRDTTPPRLESFSLDMDTTTVKLTFSEVVCAHCPLKSLDLSGIGFQNATSYNAMSNDRVELKTTVSAVLDTSGLDQKIVTIELHKNDADKIKLLTGLCTVEANTFISIAGKTIMDMSGNSVSEIANTAGVRAVGFTEDTTSPTLVRYALDMKNNAELTMVFSEPIQILTLNASKLTFLSSPSSINSYILTSKGDTTSSNGNQIVFFASKEDTNEIKKIPGLADSQSSTYISITSPFVEDMNGNGNAVILSEDAQNAQSFAGDSVSPRLDEFDMDANTGVMKFRFSETVNLTSFLFKKIIVQDSFDSNIGLQHRLTDATILSSSNNVEVEIKISDFDRNTIKRKGIALANSSCFVSIDESAVKDMSGSFSIERKNGLTSIQVKSYRKDDSSPNLNNLDFSLNDGKFTMSFSEAVDYSTLKITGLTLQNDAIGTVNYTLTDGLSFPSRKCNTCGADDFLISKCNSTHDTICKSCKQCGSGEFTLSSCNSTHDAVCKTCSTQGANQFVKIPCSKYDDAIIETCTPSQTCRSTEYKLSLCTATTNDVCQSCTVCGVEEYETKDCLAGEDRICKACKICSSNQFVTSECTKVADTICQNCSTCPTGAFSRKTCGRFSDTECESCTTCKASEFMVSECTPEKDAVCSECSGCAMDEFISQNCTTNQNTKCSKCRGSCASNQYMESSCTVTSDMVCVDCAEGCASCAGPGDSCLRCDIGHAMRDGKCYEADKCPEGTYLKDDECKECDSSCKTCTGPGASCSSCPGGMVLENGLCKRSGSCPNVETYLDSTCKVCHANCGDDCMGPQNTDCIGCEPGFFSSGPQSRTCTNTCPSGTFDAGGNVCSPCHMGCKKCSGPSATQCTECATGYKKNKDGVCVYRCPKA